MESIFRGRYIRFFLLDGLVQYALETTTILKSEKFKEVPTLKILQIQYNYGHTPFNRLQAMTTNGVPPNCLANFTFTVCAACLYVKATKLPRKTKTARSINESKPVFSVRDCVSIDVLVYSTPGLIVHIYGFIMHQSYHYACVFVDHNSDFTYVNLLTSQTEKPIS